MSNSIIQSSLLMCVLDETFRKWEAITSCQTSSLICDTDGPPEVSREIKGRNRMHKMLQIKGLWGDVCISWNEMKNKLKQDCVHDCYIYHKLQKRGWKRHFYQFKALFSLNQQSPSKLPNKLKTIKHLYFQHIHHLHLNWSRVSLIKQYKWVSYGASLALLTWASFWCSEFHWLDSWKSWSWQFELHRKLNILHFKCILP